MYDLFYIVEVSPQWYNLIVRGTHCCVSCGADLEKIKRTLYNYVRKYKTEDKVYRVLSSLEGGGKVSPATYNLREDYCKVGLDLVFKDLVRGVVSQALKDNRHDTPYHHTRNKVRTVVKPPEGVVNTAPTPRCEVKVVAKVKPLKIKRTAT